ncbi:MAG: hypothetical protein QXK35_04315 [Nitrososphaerales archaeon]
MVFIEVSKWGLISNEQVNFVLEVMEECYKRLEPHDVSLIDLLLFDTSSNLEVFIINEYQRLKINSQRFDENFPAMHDAWFGTPRIIVCFERLDKLEKIIQRAIIQHEVAHSILHGSPLYYIFTLPQILIQIRERYNLSQEYVVNLLYLISIAVKDYQVTKLLINKGFKEDQRAYIKTLLKPSNEDLTSWIIAKNKPKIQILCLISRLKDLSCAAPFIMDEVYHNEIKEEIKLSLAYLPKEYANKLFEIISKYHQLIGDDTFKAIENVTYTLSKELIEPILNS